LDFEGEGKPSGQIKKIESTSNPEKTRVFERRGERRELKELILMRVAAVDLADNALFMGVAEREWHADAERRGEAEMWCSSQKRRLEPNVVFLPRVLALL